MTQEDFEQRMAEEMQELQEEDSAEQQEEQMLNEQNWRAAYGTPEPEQAFNQHTFLANSLGIDSPEKVTFMSESELGRPLFNLRFLLDIEDICKYYLDDTAADLGMINEIANYFRAKIKNISDSGMSNKGFLQNLNASKKIDVTRSRIRNLEPLKGGKTK